jgi:hypothetical protein
MDRMVSVMERAYPKEAGYLLAGERFKDEVFRIVAVKRIADGTRSRIFIADDDVHKGRVWAGKKKLEIVGWAHSHPYPNHTTSTNMTQLSPLDVSCTSYFGFRYAMVVAFVQNHWFVDCWKMGRTAALNIVIDTGDGLVPFNKWNKE